MQKTETPGFFHAPDGTPLHGVYHAPGARAPGQSSERPEASALQGVAVIAPPLFEERKSAHGTMVQLARAIAASGLGVLRFDYRGSGESGGEAGERRWMHLAGDLGAACSAARELSGCGSLYLVGLRMGATLVLEEVERLTPAGVVAVAPIVKGAAEVRRWRLRSKMRSELTAPDMEKVSAALDESRDSGDGSVLDLDGFPVHARFLEDLQRIDLSQLTASRVSSLVVQVSHRDTPVAEYTQLAERLGERVELACFKGLPFWERVEDADVTGLIERILRFLHHSSG